MALKVRRDRSFTTDQSQPLLVAFSPYDPNKIVYYTRVAIDDGSEDPGEEALRRADALAGIWSDLDWDEAAEALDRIRHDSTPTPPIGE